MGQNSAPNAATGWNACCYGNGKYVAITYGNYFAYSTDGVTWNEGVINSESGQLFTVCYGKGKYISLNSATKYFVYFTGIPSGLIVVN